MDNLDDEFIVCNNGIIDGSWKSIGIYNKEIITNILDEIIVKSIKLNKKVKFSEKLVSKILEYEINSSMLKKCKKNKKNIGLVRQKTTNIHIKYNQKIGDILKEINKD
tara:strand:+ start:139 stop:462 length:324 start_codon:yes stop_codon:yes gene_type:complete